MDHHHKSKRPIVSFYNVLKSHFERSEESLLKSVPVGRCEWTEGEWGRVMYPLHHTHHTANTRHTHHTANIRHTHHTANTGHTHHTANTRHTHHTANTRHTHHITSLRITSHHIASHRIALHYIALHCTHTYA